MLTPLRGGSVYIVKNDKVIELTEFPLPDSGAPCPVILPKETQLWLAYFIHHDDPRFEEKYSKIWSDSNEPCVESCFAVVSMLALAHTFGQPGEHNFETHPLSKRGLQPFMVAEVKNSSWLAALTQAHLCDTSITSSAEQYRHIIFAFHDETFECLAKDFKTFIRHGESPLAGIVSLAGDHF